MQCFVCLFSSFFWPSGHLIIRDSTCSGQNSLRTRPVASNPSLRWKYIVNLVLRLLVVSGKAQRAFSKKVHLNMSA